MTTLKEWREREGLSRSAVALELGTSAESVRRYESGINIPTREMMGRIVSLTLGAVEPNDFYDFQAPTEAAE